MAVGAGSIKRASKLSTEAATTTKKEAADKPVVEKTVAKTTTRKTPAKKAPAKKAAQPSAAEIKETQPVKPVKNAAPAKEPKKQTKGNQACRLTEEMPIYLL